MAPCYGRSWDYQGRWSHRQLQSETAPNDVSIRPVYGFNPSTHIKIIVMSTNAEVISDIPAMVETASPKARSPKLLLVAAVLGIAGWLGYKWWYGLSHVSTDNAQVEGHIVPVLPKVGGFVTDVRVSDNQAVQSGELLVKIDDRDYQATLKQADAALAAAFANAGKKGMTGQAAARLAAAQANASVAQANLDQALANADKVEKDLKRIRSLIDRKLVSQQQLDDAEANIRIAAAQVKAARETAASAISSVEVSQAALRSAMADVDSAQAARELNAIRVADTHIAAPITGYVSNRNIEPGQLVQPGQMLMSIVPLDDIWIVANLKETDMKNVKPGDAAEVEIDAYSGLRLQAHVESISAATGARFSVLPPDNATGNFTKVVQRIPVRLRLNQPNDMAKPLRPGMSVFVTINTAMN